MKSTSGDTRATDSIIKSGQKDTEASIIALVVFFLNKRNIMRQVLVSGSTYDLNTLVCGK